MDDTTPDVGPSSLRGAYRSFRLGTLLRLPVDGWRVATAADPLHDASNARKESRDRVRKRQAGSGPGED